MRPDVLDYIPDNKCYGMDRLIKSLLAKKLEVLKYEIKEYWLDIGKLDDYKKAQNDFNDSYTKVK